MSRLGRFVERVCKGAFKRALQRSNDVKILLNHDWTRQLGSIAQGNLELTEDNVGLHARAIITDPEVIEDARKGNLRGWSFGFKDREVETAMGDGLPLRKVRDLDLLEVSLINRAMIPCYEGTSVYTRAEDGEKDVLYRADMMIAEEVETEVEKTEENERSTEESTDETENQEQKEPKQEKSVEKNDKMNYNKAINIINKMKENQNG